MILCFFIYGRTRALRFFGEYLGDWSFWGLAPPGVSSDVWHQERPVKLNKMKPDDLQLSKSYIHTYILRYVSVYTYIYIWMTVCMYVRAVILCLFRNENAASLQFEDFFHSVNLRNVSRVTGTTKLHFYIHIYINAMERGARWRCFFCLFFFYLPHNHNVAL